MHRRTRMTITGLAAASLVLAGGSSAAAQQQGARSGAWTMNVGVAAPSPASFEARGVPRGRRDGGARLLAFRQSQ
jgi:hypothetical protein